MCVNLFVSTSVCVLCACSLSLFFLCLIILYYFVFFLVSYFIFEKPVCFLMGERKRYTFEWMRGGENLGQFRELETII